MVFSRDYPFRARIVYPGYVPSQDLYSEAQRADRTLAGAVRHRYSTIPEEFVDGVAIRLSALQHPLASEFFIPLSPFPCQQENDKGMETGEYIEASELKL